MPPTTDLPDRTHVLAADIGGTAMRAAVVDSDGRILARGRIPTVAARGIDDATTRLGDLLAAVALQVEATPRAIGIATAGPVDPATGTYRFPPNLPGWHGRSMAPALSRAFERPVAVGHDATLAAVAETRFGHRRGARHLVYLTVSTGIGAGIVVDGHPVTGSTGGAGEAGHIIVDPGGPSCGAGCPGCLEGAASGAAIAAEARRRLRFGPRVPWREDVTAADVFAAAEMQFDPVAEDIVRTAIGYLGAGLASLLALLDPEMIIVGGGVARGLERRWPDVLAATRAHALPRYAEGVPVELTTLGDDASLLGAAAIAFDAPASGPPRPGVAGR